MPDAFRVAIIGFGNQGRKRQAVAGPDVSATVDPVNPEARYRRIEDIPPAVYDAAIICTPEEAKLDLIGRLLSDGKHVMVEKPFLVEDSAVYADLAKRAAAKGLSCYTAYNHRFEPAIQSLAACLADGDLGKILHARLYYGNGTARDVFNSNWRDGGLGVLTDLGSHLLDLVDFLFGRPEAFPRSVALQRLENRAPDHCIFVMDAPVFIECEVSLLSWKNTFSIDVIGSKGSAHVSSLVKWGDSSFIFRRRVFPSGRPIETDRKWEQPDPTWSLEYAHFKQLCRTGQTTLAKDRWIGEAIAALARSAGERSLP